MSEFDIDKALRQLLDLQDSITHENEVGTDNQRYIWGLQRERCVLDSLIKAKYAQARRDGGEETKRLTREVDNLRTALGAARDSRDSAQRELKAVRTYYANMHRAYSAVIQWVKAHGGCGYGFDEMENDLDAALAEARREGAEAAIGVIQGAKGGKAYGKTWAYDHIIDGVLDLLVESIRALPLGGGGEK